jgi:hypothetical protein
MSAEQAVKMAELGEQIRRAVSEDIAARYMELARKWVEGEIRMDQFDRRGQRTNVPIEVHTRFVLELGEAFNVSS